MIYLFSFVAGRHRWVMWLFLSLRWVGLAFVGSPVIAFACVAVLAGFHWLTLLIGIAVHIVLLFASEAYSRHRNVVLLKRRWPVLWAQVQRKQLIDMDDAHLQRPWMAAPRLGMVYKVNGSSVSLKVRPAIGQTLIDLQEQTSVIAAQTSLVDSFEVDTVKASSHRGRLKIMFTDTLAETKTAKENSHA